MSRSLCVGPIQVLLPNPCRILGPDHKEYGLGLVTGLDRDHAEARGKDLGVHNIASALPQVIAPALAAPLVTCPAVRHCSGCRVCSLSSVDSWSTASVPCTDRPSDDPPTPERPSDA
ncbi:hypothetical protein [Nocardioides jensenii]|uniref:hypothetical protein n=1 Tax=Nocardioides jensenii TaxID=1843 RepID=UPI000830202B|nr:hypothetical protein [Nocardioides jensenii]